LFEGRVIQTSDIVRGYVFGQSLNGHLILKANPSIKTSRTWEVDIDADVLSRLGLLLGSFVSIEVLRETRYDGFLRETGVRLQYVRVVRHGDRPITPDIEDRPDVP